MKLPVTPPVNRPAHRGIRRTFDAATLSGARLIIFIFMVFAVLALTVPARADGLPVKHIAGPGGVPAWLVSDHTLPLIHIKMAWRGGSATDPATRGGLTRLMARLLNAGAGDMHALVFQEVLADQAISLNFDADRDTLSGSLRCLSKFRANCIKLLKLALTAPRFDAEAITHMQAEQLARLRTRAQSPSRLAADAFMAAAYPSHPYARKVDGTSTSVEAITRAELMAHFTNHLAQDNLVLSIVGDVSKAQARTLLKEVFTELPRQNRLTLPPTVTSITGPLLRHQLRPGPQTTIVFGHQGIAYDDPLFFPAFVMNHILGNGGFAARLTVKLREKNGLAYSVSSQFSPLERGALWRGTIASNNKTAQRALDLIRAEMRRLARDGVSTSELTAAKTNMIGAYALRFDSGLKIAMQLQGVQLMGRDIGYFQTRNQRIEAVSAAQVQRAAQTLLHPDALLVSSVGGHPLVITQHNK